MRTARVIALLIAIAFVGAILTPCRPFPLTPIHDSQESAGEVILGDTAPQPVSRIHSHSAVSHASARAGEVVLKARCPCGCEERPAATSTSASLGIALISHVASLAWLPGSQELWIATSFLPTSPLSGIDTVPRSA